MIDFDKEYGQNYLFLISKICVQWTGGEAVTPIHIGAPKNFIKNYRE